MSAVVAVTPSLFNNSRWRPACNTLHFGIDLSNVFSMSLQHQPGHAYADFDLTGVISLQEVARPSSLQTRPVEPVQPVVGRCFCQVFLQHVPPNAQACFLQ